MPSFGAIGGAKGIGVQGAGSAAAQTKKRTAEHSHAGAALVRPCLMPATSTLCALVTHAQQLAVSTMQNSLSVHTCLVCAMARLCNSHTAHPSSQAHWACR